MKKILSAFLIMFVFFSSPIFTNCFYTSSCCVAYAEQSQQNDIESELTENLDNQLANLNAGELDIIIKDLSATYLIEPTTFVDALRKVVAGELNIDAQSFLGFISGLFIDDVVSFLPYVCLIIAIAVLYSMVNASRSGKNKGLSDVIHFVCYGATVVIVLIWVANILNMSSSTLMSIKNQMEAIFPLLLTVLTALGGSISVNVFQPAMAMLSGGVLSVFVNVLLPIFTFVLVFTIISHLTSGIKFGKFSEFFSSAFKWIMGIVLMLFSAVVSIQGLMAGSIDSISIKTAKYTIKSAIPVIGGFISDGVNLIMASSVLIKNAIGVGGVLLLFGTIILPIIKIIVFSFLLKLASAILEPIADSRLTGFVSSIAKSIQLLVALIVGVAFMYFVMIALVMCSTNVL